VRQARGVARGIAREAPGFRVAKPELAEGAWRLPVAVPAGLCARAFAEGVRAEGLPCEAGARPGTIALALCPSYSAEDAEQLVLAVAKVAHHMRAGARA
jgi:hypothetical protein